MCQNTREKIGVKQKNGAALNKHKIDAARIHIYFQLVFLMATNAPETRGGFASMQVHSQVISAPLPNPHPMLGHLRDAGGIPVA